MIRIDTIATALSLCIGALGIASIFPYLDAVARTTVIAALAAALMTVRKPTVLPGPLPTLLSLAAVLLYGFQFSLSTIVDTAANLLAVLLAVRLVSERTTRHHLQVAALSLFVLAASSLFELGPLFLLYMVLMLLLVAVCLVILTFSANERNLLLTKNQLRRVLSVAILLPALTVPLILLFFMVLPRTQFPLWNFLNQGGGATTGLTEEVRPGAMSAVAPVKTPAFRASMPEIDNRLLYWRGIVLNTFRENRWQREAPPDYGIVAPRGRNAVSVTILQEPTKTRYLLTLDVPERVEGLMRVRQHGDGVFSLPAPVERRIRYDAVAVPGGDMTTGRRIDRTFYLRLPDRVSPRLGQLGRIIGGGGDAGEKIARAESFYRTGRFRYATEGLPTGDDALDTFLFDRRVGHCELFASSLGVLLRLAGVPCRLVGGYYGGAYNALGGYYIVTEEMAHLWVEAFVEGRGWVRLDPSSWGSGFGPAGRDDDGLARRLRLFADTAAYSWNMAVVSYDLESQIRLFSRAGERVARIDAKQAVGTVALCCVAILGIVAAATAIRRHRPTSREERILRQFLAKLEGKYGVTREESSIGLHDLAARACSEQADRFVELYGGVVYRDRKLSREEYRRLKGIIKLM